MRPSAVTPAACLRHDHEPIGVDAQADGAVGEGRRQAVAGPLEAGQAGRRRPGAGGRPDRAVGRGPRDPALHRAQASQPPRPCAEAPAPRTHRGLPRHDLRRYRGRGADPPPGLREKAVGEMPRGNWRPRGCRNRLFTFTRLPPEQWKSARTTNAIERLNEEFRRRIKTQAVLPAPRPCRCCSGRSPPQARSRCARSTAGKPSTSPSSPAT